MTSVRTVALLSQVLLAPVVIVLYIALVTYMAANEAGETSRSAVAVAVAGVVVSIIIVLAAVVVVHPSIGQITLVVVLDGSFLVWTGRTLGPAYENPRLETVSLAVGACVLGLVVLDAAFVAITDIGWTLAALAFLVPALSCAHLFDVS